MLRGVGKYWFLIESVLRGVGKYWFLIQSVLRSVGEKCRKVLVSDTVCVEVCGKVLVFLG